jgi:hypothetical protein
MEKTAATGKWVNKKQGNKRDGTILGSENARA